MCQRLRRTEAPTNHTCSACPLGGVHIHSEPKPPPSGLGALLIRQQCHLAPSLKLLRRASYSPAWHLHVLIYKMGTPPPSTSSKCVDRTAGCHTPCAQGGASTSSQVRGSPPRHHKHPGGDHFGWGSPCAPKGVWQHPWPLPTRRQGHPCSQITLPLPSVPRGAERLLRRTTVPVRAVTCVDLRPLNLSRWLECRWTPGLLSLPFPARAGSVSTSQPHPHAHALKGCQGTASLPGSDVTTWGSL